MRRDGGQLELRGAPRQMASFVRRNLAVAGAMDGLGPFDAIVCRNVLLYFAPERARRVVDALVARLVPGGLLILGPAEVLPEQLPPGTERLMLGPWSALRSLGGLA
jgi:chemotaxis protein methyltransferase CheR